MSTERSSRRDFLRASLPGAALLWTGGVAGSLATVEPVAAESGAAGAIESALAPLALALPCLTSLGRALKRVFSVGLLLTSSGLTGSGVAAG